jgi:hypothetical protein
VKLFSTDISDWRDTFVDTGLNSPIGERLRWVRRFVDGCGTPQWCSGGLLDDVARGV